MLTERASVCSVAFSTLAVAATLSLASLAPCQQNSTVDPAKLANGGSAASEWPTDMLLVGVEGEMGSVPMGTSWKNALKWATEFFPNNRKLALRALKNTRSELGEATVDVEPFFMSRAPVTNEQYLRYVKATGNRFPFHWWKEGAKDNFESHRQKIYKAFPNLAPGDRINAPLYYWEDRWKTEKLEYKIPAGQEKFPVVFVSWKDALKYAAWAGMRIPTEPEWTFAANGGERKEFVFGDSLDESVLKKLRMSTFRETQLKAVGALGELARGPFGHQDMVGQVWEWVMPLGYGPQTGREIFEKEYKKLRKEKKFGKNLSEAPNFRPEYALAKGGSYYTFSTKDFIQARINCRAPLADTQTMSGLGFRVAKSKRPAYDMSLARMKTSYPAYLSESKEPDFRGQIGWERYDLEGAGDLIKDYHALSVVPISYLASKKGARARQLGEDSRARPLEIAVIISTTDLALPQLPAGTYVAYLRKAGSTQAQRDALNAAHKALTAAKKAREREEAAKAKAAKAKKPAKKKTEKKKKKTDDKAEKWRQVLRPFGYTDEEIVNGDPKKLAKHMYLRHVGEDKKDAKHEDLWFKISTETDQLIFRSQTGKWVAAIPTKAKFDKVNTNDAPPTITAPKGGSVDITFSVPVDQSQTKKAKRRRVITFPITLQMK